MKSVLQLGSSLKSLSVKEGLINAEGHSKCVVRVHLTCSEHAALMGMGWSDACYAKSYIFEKMPDVYL